MSQREGLAARLDSAQGRESLAAVYGKAASAAQSKRYEELGRALIADLGASGGGVSGGGGGSGATEAELRFFSAPGRTELGGNHTDHNHGKVLCAAVGLDALACVVPTEDKRVRIVSAGYAEPIRVDLADLEARPEERGRTEALVRGVARFLAERGARLRGFSARIDSRVLPGSGLSSSAAIEVLLGSIMAELAGLKLPPVEIAKIGQAAENVYFGKPCGLQDQMASAVGGIVAIDFRDPALPLVEPIDFDFSKEGYALAVVNTGGSHADLTADYAAIPEEMRAVARLLGGQELRDIEPSLLTSRGPEIRRRLGDRALLRSFHFVRENARVEEMARALGAGKLKKYLKLVRKSGDSSWRLLQNLYPPSAPGEQGLCTALALSEEFLGKEGAARVHGGGFAGTIQAYLPRSLLEGYSALMEGYFGKGSVIPLSIRAAVAGRVL